ncbi:hypothetical protein RJ639_015956 [Escallonia herrerae]|uniref:BED-type domain-containing protein n=1 Tax=Escallonia herrerae TaxID=1293975 RepID=A0AA88VCX2_9ASTE|nr:hypothetical protein RJ639_015956 [Escallonia herrerae]
MTDNSSSVASAPARSDDPAWAHGKVVAGKRNNTICIHCNKHLKGGGITRLKMHLAGVTGQVEACKKAPHDVRWQMKQLLEGYQKEKARKEKLNVDIGYGDCVDVDDDSEDVAVSADSVGSQPSIKSAMATKEMVDNVKLAVARWWYDANVPFNGAHSKDFWLQCQHVVKLSEPLVRVLHLTDSDEKPSMGYLYEAIDKAKETIKLNLKNRLSLYMPVLRVIDARAIGRTKEALDSVSLDNIDVLADWVSEEESVITQEDLDNDGGWDVLQPKPDAVNLEDEEVHYEDEEDALHGIPSQYDWEFRGERDPYHYIE